MSPITERLANPATAANQCRAVLAICVGVLLLLVAADNAPAEVIHVPGDVATIQGAIDLAADGDEIVVAAGEYHELINLRGKAVHLHSAEGPGETLIFGRELNGSVIRCVSGEGPETIIDGFTITEGTAADPETGAYGGGMLIEGSSPTVRNCRFVNNFAAYGGGLAVIDEANPTIEECDFQRNGAVTGASFPGYGRGGAVLIQQSSATIRNSRFIGNRAQVGGGLNCEDDSGVTVTECEFTSNIAHEDSFGGGPSDSPGFGGAVGVAGGSTVSIERCYLHRNAADWGGAVATTEYPGFNALAMSDSLLVENVSSSAGSAIMNASGDVLVDRCRFRKHRRLVPLGSTRVIHSWGLTSIRNSSLVANQGIVVSSSSTGFVDVINCAIYGNKSPDNLVLFSYDDRELFVRNSILWNNGSDPIYDAVVTNSIVQFGSDGDGIINANPQFTDEGQFNLRPQAESPAIDAGVNDFVDDDLIDLDHRPRIVDGDGDDLTIVDLGPYEYLPGGCDPPIDVNIVSIRIEPDDQPIVITDGFTTQLRAFADLADGITVDITDHPCAAWRTSDATVAMITSGGEVRGASVGETRIGITIGDERASAPVAVELNGDAAYVLDDGFADMSLVTWALSGAALNQFEVQPGEDLLTEILVDWGDFAFGPGTTTLYIWSDPNQDGVPNDAQMLLQQFVTSLPSHGVFQRYTIPPTYLGPPGTVFFVGFIQTVPDAMPIHQRRLLTVDTSSPQFRSWWAGDFDPVDPNALGDAATLDVLSWGNWMIRANGMPGQAGDLNHDGMVDVLDLLALIAAWGDCPAGDEHCPADLNDDGAVNVLDLLALLGAPGIWN